jgi:hypothetical protein
MWWMKGVEIPQWLCCWLEMIHEYGDREANWVEESSRGTTIGSSMSYYSTSEERNVALLYMYTNIDGMDKYFE